MIDLNSIFSHIDQTKTRVLVHRLAIADHRVVIATTID